MNAIYGLFPDVNTARRAMTTLCAESARLNIKPDGIVVMSSEPLQEECFGWKEQRTPMPWLAVLGALVGGSGGYALAAFTQRTYPLPTGGMPIVAMWPTGIVMYELTMLGAILTTILTFLIAAGLPNYKKRLYDPEVTNGKILVGVSEPTADCRAEVEQRLMQEGAVQVKEYSTN
jgi:Alternative complex III, ActD subunit